MSVEEVRPEAPAKRNFAGWIALAIMFALATFSAISVAIQPKPVGKKSYLQENALLQIITSATQSIETFSPTLTAKEKQARIDELRERLDDPISNLVSVAEKDPAATRIYAAMRTEQGKEVPAKMLDVLRKSADPIDKTYLEIYGPGTLSRERSQELALALPNRPFSNELAAIHALEKGGSKSARERISPWYMVRQLVLNFFLFGALFTGMVLWAVYLVGRRKGRFAPRGHSVGRVTPEDADRLAIRAAQIFGGYLLIGQLLAATDLKPATAALIAGLSIVALAFALARVPVGGKRITLETLGIQKEGFGKNVLWGFAGFFAELPVTATMAGLGLVLFPNLPPPSHPATDMVGDANSFLAVLPVLFVASITAPLWEEMVFRGLLFPALSRVAGSLIFGAITSSLLFAIIHPQGPVLVFALAGLASVSCGLAYQRRSLVPSIVMHMVHNTAVMIAIILTL